MLSLAGEFDAADLSILGRIGTEYGFGVFFDEESQIDETGIGVIESFVAGETGIAQGCKSIDELPAFKFVESVCREVICKSVSFGL